jgi:hypothetical protein
MLIQLCSIKTQYKVKNKLHSIPESVRESQYSTEKSLTTQNVYFCKIYKEEFLFTGKIFSDTG